MSLLGHGGGTLVQFVTLSICALWVKWFCFHGPTLFSGLSAAMDEKACIQSLLRADQLNKNYILKGGTTPLLL